MSLNETVNITPPQFLQFFGTEELKYTQDSLKDTIDFITRGNSYFTRKRLVKDLKDMVMMTGTEEPKKRPFMSKEAYQKYLEEKKKAENKKEFVFNLMKKPDFDDLVEYYVDLLCNLVPIEGTDHVTTQEMYEEERQMILMAKEQTPDHCLNEDIVNTAINARKGISEEQTDAVIACCRTNDRVTVVEGTAGAGKSFTMAAVKKAFIDSGYRIIGTALSWNAAAVLSASTGIDDCTAIEGLTRDVEKAQEQGIDYFRQKTVLIVDEAGLVGTRHMKKLLEMTRNSPHPIKVVLTGDSRQLNPVDAGSALEAIVHYHGTTRIDTIRRQKQKTHRDAVKDFSFRKSGIAINTFLQQEALHWCKNKKDQFNMVVRDFLSYKAANPAKRPLILALSNDDVTELNKMVRVAYKKMGLVYGSETPPIKVTDGRKMWETTFAIGDEIVVRANSKKTIVYETPDNKENMDRKTWVPKKVGVFNRNSGRIVAVEESKVTPGSYDIVVDMDGDIAGRMVLNTKDFQHDNKAAFPVVHNFATTIYASQGQTVQKVFLIDSDKMDFRLAYVGMSRHTDSVNIYLNEAELHTRLDRKLGKAEPNKLKSENQDKIRKSTPSELPVTGRRYFRHEMLGAVAASWGKEKSNKTAMMFGIERRSQKGFGRNNMSQSELFEIKQSPDCDEVVDFDTNRYTVQNGDSWEKIAKEMGIIEKLDTPEDIKKLTKWVEDVRKFSNFKDDWDLEAGDVLFLSERFNVPHPVIDLEKLFAIEDEIKDTEIVRTAEVNANNVAHKAPEMPLDEDLLPKKDKGKVFDVDKKERGFFDIFFRGKSSDKEVKEETHEEDVSMSDYSSLNGNIDLTPEEKKEYDRLSKKKIKPIVSIPFLEEKEKLAYIDRKGRLAFNYGGEDGPTSDFLDKAKGRFWGEGKDYEPRIFATDGRTIQSRYDLEGNCVVGQGFPPTFLNPRSNKAPFLIVPGPKEYLWTYNYALDKFREHKEIDKLPNVVWGAKGVDWSLLFKEGNDYASRTRITRGQDPKNIEWAVNLQRRLWEDNKVRVPISPQIEGHVLPWENAPQMEQRRRPAP